jgi:hypothetical protein
LIYTSFICLSNPFLAFFLDLGGDAAQGHLDLKLPILEAFLVEKSRDGRWLATFTRKAPPRQGAPVPAHAAEDLSPALAALVDRLPDAVGSGDDRPWWTQSAKRLGPGVVDRAVGQLKEAGSFRPSETRAPC